VVGDSLVTPGVATISTSNTFAYGGGLGGKGSSTFTLRGSTVGGCTAGSLSKVLVGIGMAGLAQADILQYGQGKGGCVGLLDDSALRLLEGSKLEGCRAEEGGGVYGEGGVSLEAVSSAITDCHSNYRYGGGISLYRDPSAPGAPATMQLQDRCSHPRHTLPHTSRTVLSALQALPARA
jgi:hypothetical protein